MIRRLDLPSAQGTFTAVSGVPPTSSKWTTPVSRIRYTDTVYTAPSRGLTGYWYANTSVGRTIPTSTAYISNEPLIKYWYGEGLPPFFQPKDIGNTWSLKLKGYMKLPYTGNYKFYMGGSGIVTKFELNSTNILPSNQTLSYLYYGSTTPFNNTTVDVWRLFELHYQQTKAYDAAAGFCLLWKTDNAVATPDKIVLSAGVTHIFGEGVPSTGYDAIPDTAIPHYSEIDLSLSEGQGSTFKFMVPIVPSVGAVSSAGFWYEPSTDRYKHVNQKQYGSAVLKKFRKITYWEGYRNASNVDEYVQKFSGQIREMNVQLNPSGGDKLEVICYDYGIFTKDSFNTDSPTPIDYVASGYLGKVPQHVDGLTKPPAFDGWEVHKAFMIMCMNSYLDPYYATLRIRKTNVAGTLKYGNYFVEPYGLSYRIYLDRDATKYGNPSGVSPDAAAPGVVQEPDAEYLYSVGFGEFYQDAITKITAVNGMEWGVNRLGYPYLKLIDAPRSYINDRDGTLV